MIGIFLFDLGFFPSFDPWQCLNESSFVRIFVRTVRPNIRPKQMCAKWTEQEYSVFAEYSVYFQILGHNYLIITKFWDLDINAPHLYSICGLRFALAESIKKIILCGHFSCALFLFRENLVKNIFIPKIG